MNFEYLHSQNEFKHNILLDDLLNRLSNKLRKYRCLEVGSGNSLLSIPIAKLFRSYYAIEPDKALFDIATNNINKYGSNIKLFNVNFDNFIQNKKFNIILFVNSFHFINLETILDKIKKSYIIILHPRYDSNSFGDKRLNRNNPMFDEIIYEKNKKNLTKYENFIIANFNILYNESNERSKIFLLTKK
jgi:SAM-dependent methyltransferase